MGKNLHKGYYGQYSGNSKFSKRHDEDYDAKEAYNKNLTASARLHYLENLRHDHDSPAHSRGDRNDHNMGSEDWKAHKQTMHGIRDHGGPNMVDPREDKGSYEYDYDFAADREAEKKAKKKQKAKSKKTK